MDKKKTIKILKIAVAIYLASFLIINWNDVSWIFNYKAVYGLVSDFFNPYPSIDASSMNAYFYPNHSQNQATAIHASQPVQIAQSAQPQQATKEVKTSYTDKQKYD
jgi:hypothetical protein